MITRSGILRHLIHGLQPGEVLRLVIDTNGPVGVPKHLKDSGNVMFDVVKGTNDCEFTPHGLVVYMGFATVWVHCLFPYETVLAAGCQAMSIHMNDSQVSTAYDGPLEPGRPTDVPYLRVYEGGRKDVPVTPELPPTG